MNTRKVQLYLLLFAITFGVAFVLGELTLRLVSPTEYMHPRYQYSPEYGLQPYPNTRMVHGVPGKFKFHYTVSALGTRGEEPPPPDPNRPAVVVLGDSYSFGMGVNDGEQYAAQMQAALGDAATVVNLGSPGWGLTQEIRRYYDVGAAYQPEVVVLQFCANDPQDNFVNPVTRVDGDVFEFVESPNRLGVVKKVLSRSWIQRSQLYNFFRGRAARALEQRFVAGQTEEYGRDDSTTARDTAGDDPRQALYCELLALFAKKLRGDGVPLVMIAVDNQLDRFPAIQAKVQELDAAGTLRYIEVLDWLGPTSEHYSVEGHAWGAIAHEVIGRELAELIAADYLTPE